MRALWKKFWIAIYKRNVRTQLQYLKIHRELMEEAGFKVVDIDVNIHMLNGLHRGTIRRTQIKIAFVVAIMSAIAWIMSLLLSYCPDLFVLS